MLQKLSFTTKGLAFRQVAKLCGPNKSDPAKDCLGVLRRKPPKDESKVESILKQVYTQAETVEHGYCASEM